jgi:hypothetical protein
MWITGGGAFGFAWTTGGAAWVIVTMAGVGTGWM